MTRQPQREARLRDRRQAPLERRARDAGATCGAPVAAFDLALESWGSPEPIAKGVPVTPDRDAQRTRRAALGL